MKANKIFTIIFCVIFVILSFTGCGYKKYDCLLVDSCLCQHPIDTTDVCSPFLLKEYPEDEKRLKGTTHTIKLNDIEITGDYSWRNNSPYEIYYEYRNEDKAYFSVYIPSGKIRDIRLTSTEQFITSVMSSEIADIGEEKAREIADSYATELINIPDYTVEISKPKAIYSSYDVYEIQYAKYYDGIITSDCVTVTITANGNFASLFSRSSFTMESSTPSYFKLNKLHRVVDKKVKELFKNVELTDFTYEIKDKRVFTADGHVWLDCDIDYSYLSDDGERNNHLLEFYVVVK